MAALRAWHPVRLTVVCVVLALAGGGASGRSGYAEVATPTSAALSGARARVRRTVVRAPRAVWPEALATRAQLASRAPLRISVPADPARAVAARYLTHCSLLL